MSSIITKAAAGLGAAVIALGLGTAPAFAATPAPNLASGPAIVAQSAGHWQDLGAMSSARRCLNAVIYYGFLGVEAQCRPVDGTLHLYIWVPD